MPGKAYIGEERRKGERRQLHTMSLGDPRDRRSYGLSAERRQEALSGVIGNMSAEDMLVLRKLHEKYEALGPIGKAGMTAKPDLTYDEIIAREA